MKLIDMTEMQIQKCKNDRNCKKDCSWNPSILTKIFLYTQYY